MTMSSDLLTVAQVAKLCGVTTSAVYQRLGVLKAQDCFGVYVIPRIEAEKYRSARLSHIKSQLTRTK